MAQRVRVDLVDDVDGSPAEESVNFALDGVNYVIDLSAENASKPVSYTHLTLPTICSV